MFIVRMDKQQREFIIKIAERLLPKREQNVLLRMKEHFKDEGFGYDIFGFEPEFALACYMFFNVFYKYWFRVSSEGHKNIPSKGPVILAPNHSGAIPLDFIMIAIDIMKRHPKPRLARGVVDFFAGALPYINLLIYRSGSVIGARENVDALLSNDNIVVIFPEGTKGIGKSFSQRYKLVRFNVGFIEFSIKYRAPIIPVAVIGAEEQQPQIGKIKSLGRLMGLPYLPVTPTFPWLGPLGLLPLPTKYYIYYGRPFKFYQKYKEVPEPFVLQGLAEKIRRRIQEMLNNGLKRRKGVFSG